MAYKIDKEVIPNPIAYARGYDAFFKNEDCPYPKDSNRSKEWQRGFDKAYFDNREGVLASITVL